MSEKLEDHRKAGIMIILVAIVLMIATLLMSDGYNPNLGLLYSLNELMTVYDDHPFGCSSTQPAWLGDMRSQDCSDSFHLLIASKYLILAWLVLALFGAARFFGIAKPIKEYLPKS